MKARIQKKAPGDSIRWEDIPTAYNISSELLVCKKQGLKARRAVAWIEGGRVQVSLDEDFVRKRPARKSRQEIFQKWLDESGLSFSAADQGQAVANAADKVRYIRCVAASNGDRWDAWKELDICRILINPPDTPLDRCVSVIPIEYTIFDPDKAADVWFAKNETGIHDRCLNFAIGLLNEIARVYCLAVELIEGFEVAFDALGDSRSRSRTQACKPADLIRNCKKAAINLIESVGLMDATLPKRFPEPAIALRQGFLVGRWLAQAEGIIANAREMKLALQQGVSGQHTIGFWSWLIEVHKTTLEGKTAAEVFTWLDGKPDPDFKGQNLQIVDDKLRRGNGETIKLAAFMTAFSRAKSRARKVGSNKKVNT